MRKCLVVLLVFSYYSVFSQSATSLFKQVNVLYEQGKNGEARTRFVEATELLIADSAASSADKISALLTAYKLVNINKGRDYLLLASQLAVENSQEFLFFDKIEEIRAFYHQLSLFNPELYAKLKSSAYNYSSIHVPVYSVDTLSKNVFEVRVMIAKAIGIYPIEATLKTQISDNWFHFAGDLKESSDSILTYTFDVSRYNDFIGFGDDLLVELSGRIPDFEGSYMEELYLNYHSVFTGNYNEKIQGVDLLFCTDYQMFKPIFDAFYVFQISDIYDAYKGDSILMLKASTGAFKDLTLNDVFSDIEYADINLFLDYVSDFPSKYLGQTFKLSETFATWIINNAPLSFNSLTRYFLNLSDQEHLILKFKQEIEEDGLLEFWISRSQSFAKEFRYQDALEIEKLVYTSSVVLDLSEQKLQSAIQIAALYQELNHFQAAKKYKQIAKELNQDIIMLDENSTNMNLVVQANHSVPYSLEYHPSGRYYYTSSWDGKIKVWDANLNKLIREYHAHSDMIRAMEVKLDGKHLVTGDWMGRIKIWEISGSKLTEIRSIMHSEDVNEVHFCNAEETSIIAYCGGTKYIHLYNWELDKKREIEKHTGTVSALSFNDGGTFLYSGGRDSFIYKWPVHLIFDDWDMKIDYTHWFKEPAQIFQLDVSPNSVFLSAVRSDSIASLWDVEETENIGTTAIHMFTAGNMIMYSPTTFDPKNKFFVFTNTNNKLSIVDLSSLKLKSFNHSMGNLVSDIDFHPSGNILALTGYYNSETEFMELSNFDVETTTNISTNIPRFTSTKAYKINFNKSGEKLIAQLSMSSGPSLTSLNLTNGEHQLVQNGLYHILTPSSFQNAFITWSPNEVPVFINRLNERKEYSDDTLTFSNLNYFLDNDREILYTFDLEGAKTLSAYDLEQNRLLFEEDLVIENEKNWNCGFVTNRTNKLYRFDASTGKSLKPYKLGFKNKIYDVKQLNNGNLAIESHWSIVLVDAKSRKKIWKHRYRKWKERDNGEMVTSLKVSEDQKLLAFATYYYNLILLDASNKFKKVLEDSSSNWFINDIAFHPSQKTIAFCNEENKIRLIDFSENKVLVDLYPQNTGSFIWVNPENYYWAGKQDLGNIAFEIGGKIYPSEQFDVTYNRPDKVLRDLQLGDAAFVDAIQLASTKRIKRLGIQAVDITSFPNINFKNKASLPILTNDDEITIKVEAFDFKNQLQKLNIAVNGVLVSQTNLSGNEWDSIITVALSYGENAIKVWVENEAGLQSLKEGLNIKCNYKTSSNLYLFTMSVSEYKDSTYNLNYAVKDGQDLVKAFQTDSVNYDSIIVNTFYNQAVNDITLSEIADKLKHATVHDQVILFISGHGLLDANYDFFFAGYNCNFDNPNFGGIAYEDIEKVLQNCKARKRLLLMDACHSGEVDKDAIFTSDTLLTLATGQKSGVKSYSYKGAGMEDDDKLNSIGLTNSFELMKELFSEFNSNGTQVISAAAGNSYALESKEWENGVFTYSILDGLINSKADLNGDGEIRISELKKYVSDTVFDLTFGQQRPTTREENVEFDFKVW